MSSVASVLLAVGRVSIRSRAISKTPQTSIAPATAPVTTVSQVPSPLRGASGCGVTDPREPFGRVLPGHAIQIQLRSLIFSGVLEGRFTITRHHPKRSRGARTCLFGTDSPRASTLPDRPRVPLLPPRRRGAASAARRTRLPTDGTHGPQRDHVRAAWVDYSRANAVHDPVDHLAFGDNHAVPVDSHYPSQPTSPRIRIGYDLVASGSWIDDPTDDIPRPHMGGSYEEPALSIVAQTAIGDGNRRKPDVLTPEPTCFLYLWGDCHLESTAVQRVSAKALIQHVGYVAEAGHMRSHRTVEHSRHPSSRTDGPPGASGIAHEDSPKHGHHRLVSKRAHPHGSPGPTNSRIVGSNQGPIESPVVHARPVRYKDPIRRRRDVGHLAQFARPRALPAPIGTNHRPVSE